MGSKDKQKLDPRVLAAWLLIPATLAATIGGSVALRDYIAVSPDRHDKDITLTIKQHDRDIGATNMQLATHVVDYRVTAEKTRKNCQDIKQSTIDGLRGQITDITITKAGASQEVLAAMLALEDSVNKLIAKAETEKAEC